MAPPAARKPLLDPYNTFLTPQQEAAFAVWKQRMAPNDSGEDYDLRGAFLADAKHAANGHMTDQFKKPNHPTFSNQSQYAPYAPEQAGQWGGKDGNDYIPGPARTNGLLAGMRLGTGLGPQTKTYADANQPSAADWAKEYAWNAGNIIESGKDQFMRGAGQVADSVGARIKYAPNGTPRIAFGDRPPAPLESGVTGHRSGRHKPVEGLLRMATGAANIPLGLVTQPIQPILEMAGKAPDPTQAVKSIMDGKVHTVGESVTDTLKGVQRTITHPIARATGIDPNVVDQTAAYAAPYVPKVAGKAWTGYNSLLDRMGVHYDPNVQSMFLPVTDKNRPPPVKLNGKMVDSEKAFLKMERAGFPRDEMWRQTGIERHPITGQLRWEMPDDKAGFKIPYQDILTAMKANGGRITYKAGDIIDHPELFARQPHLLDMPITFDQYETGGGLSPRFFDQASFDARDIARNIGADPVKVPGTNRQARGWITLGTRPHYSSGTIEHAGETHRDYHGVLKSALHELQHGVRQATEGFPEGANASQVGQDNYWKNVGETEARLTPYRQHLNDRERRMFYPGAEPTGPRAGSQPSFQHDFPYSEQVIGPNLSPGLWGAKYGWDKSPESPANAPVAPPPPVPKRQAAAEAKLQALRNDYEGAKDRMAVANLNFYGSNQGGVIEPSPARDPITKQLYTARGLSAMWSRSPDVINPDTGLPSRNTKSAAFMNAEMGHKAAYYRLKAHESKMSGDKLGEEHFTELAKAAEQHAKKWDQALRSGKVQDPEEAAKLVARWDAMKEPGLSEEGQSYRDPAKFAALAAKGKVRQALSYKQELRALRQGKRATDFDFTGHEDGGNDYESGKFTDEMERRGYHVVDDGYGRVFVGKDEASVKALMNARTPLEYGRAYGYPESDIAAFYVKRRGGDVAAGYEDYVRDLNAFGKPGIKEPEGPYRPDPKLDRQTTNKTAHPGWISQRLPVGKGKGAENPLKQSLMIGTKEFLMEPKRAEKAVGLLKQVPGFDARGKRESTPDYANRFVRHAADNLLHLHDRMDPGLLNRAQRWYPGGRKLVDKWSKDYKVPDIGVAGNIAALSPQKDWFENVSLGHRTLDAFAQRKDVRVDSSVLDFAHERLKPEQAATLRALKGKSLDELIKRGQMHEASLLVRSLDEAYGDRRHRLITPEGTFGDYETNADGKPAGTGWQSFNAIENALTSLAKPTRETVNRTMGKAHKVRNFYNNLLDPWSPHKDVTVDTHAGAAGLLSPLSGNDEMTTYILGQGGPGSDITGVRGLYGLLADAHRVAAQERGLIPRAQQSITWEGVRGLFRPEWKGNKANRAAVAAIWKEAKDGKISDAVARKRIEALAGGMAPPAWK